jgi:tRNA threonylcarbamoyladenosine biosynthesis protein TsaE
MTLQRDSSKSDDTFVCGEQFGRRCRGGELFVLSSDLGGGKTTFTKGLAKGLGSNDVVGSPTFTVSKVYNCRDGIELHHFDFYRLQEGGMVAMELSELIGDPKMVVVVEWGDIIDDQLPPDRIVVRFDRIASNEDGRTITVELPESFAYLKED